MRLSDTVVLNVYVFFVVLCFSIVVVVLGTLSKKLI